MTNKNTLSINQKTFPGIKKSFTVNMSTGKILIKQQSFIKSDEIEFDLDRLNPNTQRIKHLALLWLVVSLSLSLYLIVCTSAWWWKPPVTMTELTLYIFGQSLLLLAVVAAWWRFFNNSFNLTVFFDKYTNAAVFSLFTNRPDVISYETFVQSLKKIVTHREQTRSIQFILRDIPTHILVDEFSSSYIGELYKRGIDVGALLTFLQKRALHSLEGNAHPSLQ